ncbi:hypothetical protein BN938_1391 [Mucinivorans hirudinis]|uniref:Uncharacterized protein n=1 Tax=Mucinivorans hirudinis TaxID=1433126 RepID=A0A060RCF6_9BACT|nr:hypothetical protein BN938_1391 [Mucinivorans hirudinis]
MIYTYTYVGSDGSSMNRVDPNDVESISVLKDAASADQLSPALFWKT